MHSFKTKFLPIVLTLSTVTFLTVLSMLYAQGYRLSIIPNSNSTGNDSAPITVTKTGILAVRSIPDSAKIYINDELKDLTNATINSLIPGQIYTVKVEKEGFETWQKNVQVYEDKVTDITALLVLKGSGLNPLTTTGVSEFALSSNGELLAYLSDGEEKPGLWLLQLSNNPLNIFQTNKRAVALDLPGFVYSSGEEIFWSPNDQEILVKMNNTAYLLIDLTKPANQTPITYSDPLPVFDKWSLIDAKNKEANVEALNIPAEIVPIAVTNSSVWSPDGEKFYTLTEDANRIFVTVYNYEDPLPVGEQVITNPVSFSVDSLPTIHWYSDSKHLLLVTSNNIELINIDGSNRVELFSGNVLDAKAFPNPGGDRIILLSKFKSNAPENLYTVSIR